MSEPQGLVLHKWCLGFCPKGSLRAGSLYREAVEYLSNLTYILALFSLIFIEEEFKFRSVDFLVIHSASFSRYNLSATPLHEFDPFLGPLCPTKICFQQANRNITPCKGKKRCTLQVWNILFMPVCFKIFCMNLTHSWVCPAVAAACWRSPAPAACWRQFDLMSDCI